MKSLVEWFVRFLGWLARRPLLKVRITQDDPEKEEGGLSFEVENIRPTPTSLSPTVKSTFLFPRRGAYRKGRAVFDVRELDRSLRPFTPKMFSASARRLPPGYGHAWFRVYCFSPRRGPRTKVRIRNALLEVVGPFRFWFERWRFLITGGVKKNGPMSLSDYRR